MRVRLYAAVQSTLWKHKISEPVVLGVFYCSETSLFGMLENLYSNQYSIQKFITLSFYLFGCQGKKRV